MTFLETTPAARDDEAVPARRSVRPDPAESLAISRLDVIEAAVTAAIGRGANRVTDGAWSVLHVLGAHRWRDGYQTDLERGWTQYRGSRCTICDAPWEGW